MKTKEIKQSDKLGMVAMTSEAQYSNAQSSSKRKDIAFSG
jgi:hypothetical protein